MASDSCDYFFDRLLTYRHQTADHEGVLAKLADTNVVEQVSMAPFVAFH